MARKSRKQAAVKGVQQEMVTSYEEKQVRIPTAVYGRLSNEKDDDSTMEGQILLVRNFIESKAELEYVDTYFDNGVSGTTFKRPEFMRLMEDIGQKKVLCVVVKDLSRFGRNFLESCYYIEKIFPFLGVRLIAVTDDFDSSRKEDMEGLAVPITSLVNAMYAKDISKKVWTSLQKRKKDGFSLGMAPFGYIRNPETMRYEIDHEAAAYVRLIFTWKILGVSLREIGRRLDLLGAPTPGMRAYQLGMKSKPQSLIWNGGSIREILSNAAYVGDTVSNKTNQALFAGQEKVKLPKEEWVVTRNTHPAIVARDDFERIQDILAEEAEKWNFRRQEMAERVGQFRDEMQGLVFCADCGKRMEFNRFDCADTNGKLSCCYVCKPYRSGGKCCGHHITDTLLKVLVMDQIHLFIENLCDYDHLMQEAKTAFCDGELEAVNAKVLQARARTNEMADKRRKLYEDYVSGTVDMEDYLEIRNAYSQEYGKLQEAQKAAEREQEEVNERFRQFKEMVSHLKQYLDIRDFDAELVKELVERVEVGSGRNIRITFRFRDIFEPVVGEEGKAVGNG